jgi:uncharacterized protein (TIGR03435 family)
MAFVLFLCAAAAAQAQITFEAASIRPSVRQPNGRFGNYKNTGGPGTNDSDHMILENFDLRSLILKAYDLPFYRISAPDWLFDVRFNVTANIAPGATKEQFLLMQQELLATRFGLMVHHEKKEMDVYQLLVAKGGSKVKEAGPPQDQGPDEPVSGPLKRDGEGFPILPIGTTMAIVGNGYASYSSQGGTIEHFASMLAGQLQAPVTDATGLTGKYDFTLKWIAGDSHPGDDPGLNLEGSLPQQLGLMLKKMKGPVDVLVVDHVDRAPSDN